MIFKIPKCDFDAMKYACAVSDLLVTEYTCENTPGLFQVEITELDGRELKPEYAFRVGQMFENRVISSRMKTLV